MALCAGLVLIGSADYQTTRVWGSSVSGPSMIEGWGRWAGETILCALAALGALILALWAGDAERHKFQVAAVGAAACLLALASAIGGRYWRRLLDEREQERDYALTIASGLPLVTVASAIGAALALVLAVALLARRR